jgi:hypothetical protein
MSVDDDPSPLDELIGQQLSAVTFVQDYVQLWFNGPGINITNPVTVKTASSELRSWAPGFRDLLCGQIAKVVSGVYHQDGAALTIAFSDESELSVSLREADYSSPEAFYAHGLKNGASVVG